MTKPRQLQELPLLDDEWEAPPANRRVVVVTTTIALALIIAGVALFKSSARMRMWEPDDERAWVQSVPVPVPAPAPVPAPVAMSTLAEPPTARVDRSPGYLSISSRPWAEVSVDGHLIGNTPLIRIRLTPGRHRLLLVRDGFRPHAAWVNVPAGGTVRITNITLEEISP